MGYTFSGTTTDSSSSTTSSVTLSVGATANPFVIVAIRQQNGHASPTLTVGGVSLHLDSIDSNNYVAIFSGRLTGGLSGNQTVALTAAGSSFETREFWLWYTSDRVNFKSASANAAGGNPLATSLPVGAGDYLFAIGGASTGNFNSSTETPNATHNGSYASSVGDWTVISTNAAFSASLGGGSFVPSIAAACYTQGWARKQGATNTASPGATISFSSAVSSGSIVVGAAYLAGYSGAIGGITVTDDKGNTYQVVDFSLKVTGSVNWPTVTFWSNGLITNGPSSVTITASGATIIGQIEEFAAPAGATSVSVDGHSINVDTTGTLTGSLATGSFTPANNGDLIWTGGLLYPSGGTVTTPTVSGFTAGNTSIYASAYYDVSAYEIQATAGAINPTWAHTSTDIEGGAGSMAFYAAVGGGSATLNASVTTFTETGKAATLIVSTVLGAAKGTFTETGKTAALIVSTVLGAAKGTFTETGKVATLSVVTRLSAAKGTFTETGKAVTFLISGTQILSALKGTFTETGQPSSYALIIHTTTPMAAATGKFKFRADPWNTTHNPTTTWKTESRPWRPIIRGV